MLDLRSRLQTALGDRYRIVREAGSGGAGVVFIAEDVKHGRSVALKVLRPELARSLGADRFLREIRIAAQLNHPNIVSLIDSGEADGLLYYVMFYVEGESLRDRLTREKQLPIGEALRITREVADALSYAHDHGVIHRDIKPENILFEAGHAVVADFGIARALQDAGADRLTETGLAIGTPAYMSPEQAAGAAVDARADVYSLACVLYEMLAGSPPWDGATPHVILARKTLEAAPSLRIARSTVPASVEAAIGRALAPTPADRPATIGSFIEALTARPAGESALRRTLSRVPRLPLALAASIVMTVLLIGTVARFTNRDVVPIPPSFMQLTSEAGVEDTPCVSPDGNWLVYAGDGGGDRDIFLRSMGGERVIPLTEDSPADDTQPVFSPDGDRIVFRSDRDGGGIFVMGRTGEGVRRITDHGYNPDWSPDGTQIVYAMESVGLTPLNWELRSTLWVVGVAGGPPRRISEGDAVDPSWSPHGHRIAYTRRWADETDERAQMDIVTIPADGGSPASVTTDAASDWSPAWSADGRFIFFASDRGGSMNLWRVRIDEESGRVLGDPQPVTAPAPFVAHPCTSANGTHIVFSSVITPAQNAQKAPFDPATGTVGTPVWLTTGTRRWANPDPTADGEWVALYSQDRPEGDLYVVRGDGTGLRQLTGDSAVDRVPRWSPDGSLIQYFSNRSGPLALWVIRPDGSDNRQLSGGGHGIGVWSPDGSRVISSSEEGTTLFDPLLPPGEQNGERLPRADSSLAQFRPNDWSRDGAYLAGSVDYQDTGIVTYSFRTGEYRKLTDFGQWPVFLPDSRRILFVSGGRAFHLVDVETGDVTRVYSTPYDVLGPPRLTRDAREIYFTRRVTESDVWLVTLQ